jgi:hypothetical protein
LRAYEAQVWVTPFSSSFEAAASISGLPEIDIQTRKSGKPDLRALLSDCVGNRRRLNKERSK